MKKNAILFLFLCSFSIVAAYEPYNPRANTNDRVYQDSIKVLNKRIKDLKGYTEKNEEKIKELNVDIENLEKDAKIENSKLERQIQELENSVNTMKRNSASKKEAGREKIFNDISKAYNETFWEMKNKDVDKKISYVEKYFVAKQVLTKKYDPIKMKNAINGINGFKKELEKEDPKAFEKLKDLLNILDKYKVYSSVLEKAIQEIIKIDNDKEAQKKQEKILSILSQYVYDMDFSKKYKDYPYLSGIILEIMATKQKNVNADISGLLKRL
ncbi:MAG: hypothetical protein FWC26_10960 [Fibromonadales bacterium]|nr:hypothetical protein [Fibromonadales bacterium]